MAESGARLQAVVANEVSKGEAERVETAAAAAAAAAVERLVGVVLVAAVARVVTGLATRGVLFAVLARVAAVGVLRAAGFERSDELESGGLLFSLSDLM